MEWSLIVGPGARMPDLRAFLVPAQDGGDVARLPGLDDLGELLELRGGSGRIVLAGDELEAEDVGLVRRFLKRETGFELVLVGADPSRRAVRSLLREPRARWLAWPPDLEELSALMRAPDAAAPVRASAPRARATPPAAREPHADALVEELSQIEAILGAPASSRTARAATHTAPVATHTAPAAKRGAPVVRPAEELAGDELSDDDLDDEFDAEELERELAEPRAALADRARDLELDDDDDDEPVVELAPVPRASVPSLPVLPAPASAPDAAPSATNAAPSATNTNGAPAQTAPAPYFRDQVADLADLAQTIELGVARVREGAQDAPDAGAALDAPLEALNQDVARLLQFTRTLGYQVAPPVGGTQNFDLGELVEVFVQSLVARGANAPRCLWRKNGGARVLSDRQLLSQAFDALFYVAGHAAARGEIVRVQLRPVANDAARVAIAIEFPAGPLAELDPARVLEPYALRRTLPELGPNALLAARGIVRGQGGELTLARTRTGTFEWNVVLPRAPAAPGTGTPPRNSGGRAEDPFA